MKAKLKRLIFYFFLFAIIGWCWEVLVSVVIKGQLVNRGILFGPWVPIYGFGAVIAIVLSEKIKEPWQFFLTIFVASGVLEYCTAIVLETLYHSKWWDYTDLYFNFQGRICLEYLLLFAIVASLTVYLIVPFVDRIYKKINPKIMTVVLTVLLIAIFVDLAFVIFKPNTAAVVSCLVPRVGIEPALYP